ncbi:hypothetical protein JFQ93_004009 [Aeromonas sobria]|nr:hypothetical protein [Aeromonas sobria]
MAIYLTPLGFSFDASGNVTSPNADVSVNKIGRGYYDITLLPAFPIGTGKPIIHITPLNDDNPPAVGFIFTSPDYRRFRIGIERTSTTDVDCDCAVTVGIISS